VVERRKNNIDLRHPTIFEGFDTRCYEIYDRIKKGVNRIDPMLHRLSIWYKPEDIPPQISELLILRKNDPDEHTLVWQTMRNRFHPDVSYKMKRKKLNKDATAFWDAKIRGAFSRAAQRSSGGGICKEWNGPDGRVAMYEYVMQLWNTQNGLCAVSGLPMSTKVGSRKSRLLRNIASIDRIDSRLPYQPGNLQLVCWWVNHWKSNMSMPNFYKAVKSIAIHKGWYNE